MVYETDFYTTRRPYGTSRPIVSSYTVSTPRYELTRERPGQHRSHGSSDYSYSSSSETRSVNSSDPYARPERSSYSSTVERSSRHGPGGDYNYSTERSSTTGAGPGGYSYSSTTSGRLPGGTTYRHYSYRV